MKITCLRARCLEIAVSVYSLVRGSRPGYCVREDFCSRTREVRSGCPMFGRGAILLLWPYYVWEFRSFLCLTFFVVSLLCNHNKIL